VPPPRKDNVDSTDSTSPAHLIFARKAAAQESSLAAFIYFLTATGMSAIAILAAATLFKRHSRTSLKKHKRTGSGLSGSTISEPPAREHVSMWTLFKKLHWLNIAVFMCFAVTMMFPVFTQAIVSVRDPATSSRIFDPSVFIPLSFLFWNIGDLTGRLLPLSSYFALPHSRGQPIFLFIFSVLRLLFIPLYFLCNINGDGAKINSDFFLLFVVQLGFGISNGWLGSSCMMAAASWVNEDEREASGGFMGLSLVGGLAAGSLLSFVVKV
jgi:solute carrier family 29 (equilibrative nucleoside transporter), member 1/2/3